MVDRIVNVGGSYYEGDLPPTPVLPQFVGVPARNRNFVGREDVLSQLGRSTTTVITQAAVGMGGVGKTTLAAEFCHRARDTTDVVRWLVAEDRLALTTAYRNIAKWLALDVDDLDADEAIARIRHWFEHTDRSWLLVFDNAEHPDDLEDLIPTRGNGRVLVTSRRRHWPGALPLEVLAKADAVALLCQITGRPPSPEAEALVDHLGHLALAIDQAAAFCRETGWSFEAYQRDLVLRPDDVDSALATVWQRSIDRAEADCPGARGILDVLAYFAPDDIPVSLVPGDDLQAAKSLAALARYSLVDLTRAESGKITAVSVHRLVQDTTRRTHDSDDPCTTAVDALRRAFPEDPTEPGTWPTARALEPHVLVAVDHAEERSCSLGNAAWLLDCYGAYLRLSGLVHAAPAVSERAVKMYVEIAGEDDLDLITYQANLATCYSSVSRNDDAIDLREQVLADYERILDDDDPDIFQARANLATSYWAAGRHDDAIPIEKQVLADYERTLGRNHPGTIRARYNLAVSIWSVGRSDDAIPILLQALAEFEEILGCDHPHTLSCRSHLAVFYMSVGRIGTAIELLKQVVERQERSLGMQHPHTVRSRDALAEWTTTYGEPGPGGA